MSPKKDDAKILQTHLTGTGSSAAVKTILGRTMQIGSPMPSFITISSPRALVNV